MVQQTLRALVTLARPRGAVWIVLLPAIGYGWGHWDYALDFRHPGGLVRVLAAWAALHAGTMWLNADLDRDQGEVLWGSAVRVPRGVRSAGYAALVLCVLLALAASPVAGLLALGAAVLSVLYSHPRTRWKGHPLGGPAVNLVGYGLLSPLVGWVVVDVPPTPRGAAILGGLVLWTGGAYLAAQVFQEDEDRDRGYRTAVVVWGPRRTLEAARVALLAGWALLLGLAAAGWLPRVLLLALPLAAWADRWVAAWLSSLPGDEARARGLAGRLLLGGLALILLAYGQYAWDLFAGHTVSGLATAGGHPSPSAIARSRGWAL